MGKFILIFVLIFHVCNNSFCQRVLFNGIVDDNLSVDRELTIQHELEKMFRESNNVLGEDSINSILRNTVTVSIPLYEVESNDSKTKKKGVEQNDNDTLRLHPHNNLIAWEFLIYLDHIIGYYHFGSQNNNKSGDYYVVKTIDNPNLQIDIFQFPLNNKNLFYSWNHDFFSIYNYILPEYYFQDNLVMTVNNNCIGEKYDVFLTIF